MWWGVLACGLLELGIGCRSTPADLDPGRPLPRLVLVIAVDQLIPERLDPALPGGLGRIAREGRVFTDVAHAHAFTETCPGHAVMLTGVHPGRAGIPGNSFIAADAAAAGRLEVRYCVQDDGPEGALLTPGMEPGSPALDAALEAGSGRSPRQLRATTLGDWMKSHWPKSRVFAVSGKDRAAIALGGQRPDAAYWLDRSGSGAFTTSRYYRDALPRWVQAWTRDRVLAGVPAVWDYGRTTFPAPIREDDYAFESDRFGRTAPHPLAADGATQRSLAAVEVSPYLDLRTLAFAEDLVAQEALGADETPDLLALSLSATDLVGHHYGPFSREAWAALIALDAELAGILQRLEARVGEGRLLVALSSDHGVLPIPEWWQTHGGSRAPCPVAGGRVSPAPIGTAISQALVAAFGPDWADAVVQDGFRLGFDPLLRARDGVSLEQIEVVLRPVVEGAAGFERIWSRADIDAPDAPQPDATLYRNSLAPDRGGDLFLQPANGCLVTGWPSGTSHGAPYAYDRAVPLAFWGAGVEPARVADPAVPVDMAPTLGAWLGLAVPVDLDGRVLPLAGDPGSLKASVRLSD